MFFVSDSKVFLYSTYKYSQDLAISFTVLIHKLLFSVNFHWLGLLRYININNIRWIFTNTIMLRMWATDEKPPIIMNSYYSATLTALVLVKFRNG